MTLPTVPLPDPTGLSPVQTRVAAALAQGATVTGAAREAGIHRTTIHHWFRTEPRFNQAVQQARAEFAATLADELKDLATLALATLRDLLTNPNTPASVRLKAALAVLNRPELPGKSWSLPEPLPDGEAPAAVKPPAELPAILPAIARSAPCACGSGQKYKRCCGRNAPPLLSQAA